MPTCRKHNIKYATYGDCSECIKRLTWSNEELATLDYSYQQGWVYEFPGWAAIARMVNDVHGNDRTASECVAEYARYCDALRRSQNDRTLATQPAPKDSESK